MDQPPPLPIIFQYRCTGCGICAEKCPTAALTIRNGKAAITNPDACTYCLLCEDACPEGAIALPFTVLFADQKQPA